MSVTIKYVRDLHQLGFQKNLHLKNQYPNRYKLIMKFLGITDTQLNELYRIKHDEKLTVVGVKLEAQDGEGTVSITKQGMKIPKDTKFKNKVIDTSVLESMVINYRPVDEYSTEFIKVEWDKKEPTDDDIKEEAVKLGNVAPTTYTLKTEYDLENRAIDFLGGKPKELTGDDKNENFLNLIVLFPFNSKSLREDIKKPEEEWNTEEQELGWTIFEKELDKKAYRQVDYYALIMAIQLMSNKDTRLSRCKKLIELTCLNTHFHTEDYVYEHKITKKSVESTLLNNIALVDELDEVSRQILGCREGTGTIIKTIFEPKADDYDYFDHTKLINFNSTEDKKEVRKEKREDDVKEDYWGMKSRADDFWNRDANNLITLARGMRTLMAHVPGVMCKLKIPIDPRVFEDKVSVEGKLIEPSISKTWIFGPAYWIDFLNYAEAESKHGGQDRKNKLKPYDEVKKNSKYIFEF